MSEPAPAARQEQRGLWQRRPFVAVFIGGTISLLGDGLYSVALPWWVLQATGSTAAMAALDAVETAVRVIVAPFMGTLADRLNRRWAMLTMDLVRALLVCLPAVLVLTGRAALWPVLGVAAGLAACSALFLPAKSASMLDLAGREHLLQANAVNASANQLSQVASLALGGTVVAWLGVAGALLADAGSFIASALGILAAGPFAQAPPRRGRGFLADMGNGLRYVLKTPVILGLTLAGTVVNLVASPLLDLIAPKSKEIGGGVQGFGWLLAATFIGFGVGGAALTWVSSRVRFRRGWLGCLALPLTKLAASAMGGAANLPAALAAALVMGVFLGWSNILTNTGIQSLVPQELQGRVNGFMTTIFYGLMPLGYLAGGLLADSRGAGPVITAFGLALAVVSLVTFILPGMKDIP